MPEARPPSWAIFCAPFTPARRQPSPPIRSLLAVSAQQRAAPALYSQSPFVCLVVETTSSLSSFTRVLYAVLHTLWRFRRTWQRLSHGAPATPIFGDGRRPGPTQLGRTRCQESPPRAPSWLLNQRGVVFYFILFILCRFYDTGNPPFSSEQCNGIE